MSWHYWFQLVRNSIPTWSKLWHPIDSWWGLDLNYGVTFTNKECIISTLIINICLDHHLPCFVLPLQWVLWICAPNLHHKTPNPRSTHYLNTIPCTTRVHLKALECINTIQCVGYGRGIHGVYINSSTKKTKTQWITLRKIVHEYFKTIWLQKCNQRPQISLVVLNWMF